MDQKYLSTALVEFSRTAPTCSSAATPTAKKIRRANSGARDEPSQKSRR
jgi:hypothetical protein